MLLSGLGITDQRFVYDTSDIANGGARHNLHQTHYYTDSGTGILDQWHAWLTTHGVLP